MGTEMRKGKEWGRLLTAMVTPFDAEGKVDYKQAKALARRLVETGSEGIVVAGTTGESPTLSEEEKLALFAAVVEAVGGEASVIAGTGLNNTAGSIKLTQAAEKVGVDGILLVAPYYNKPPQEGLYRHFAAIAAATPLPIMLYNIPSRTSVNILPATVARLAEIPNIVAIKESSGDLKQVGELRAQVPPSFQIYSGDDNLTLPIMALGGVGVVSVASHLVGRRLREMVEAFAQGKVATASKINAELMSLFQALFVTTNPIPVKAALNMVGFPVGGVRLPLVPATEKELGLIKAEMQKLGIL